MSHRDTLENLNKHIPLRDKLITAHESMCQQFPFIERVAVTLYDAKTVYFYILLAHCLRPLIL